MPEQPHQLGHQWRGFHSQLLGEKGPRPYCLVILAAQQWDQLLDGVAMSIKLSDQIIGRLTVDVPDGENTLNESVAP
ncbi:MAG TPA: hypothetical protein VGG98_07065, partial [Solirubrobacteraceae bacterium]